MLLNCGIGEDSWESLGLQEIKLVNLKGHQSWIYSLEGLIVKLKFQYFGQPDAKNWLIGKDPDAGKDWRQEEKGRTEDEMVGWYHQLDGHEFEQALGVGDGQGCLVCCSPWGLNELDTTEQLNWTELYIALGASQVAQMVKNLYTNAGDARNASYYMKMKQLGERFEKKF